MTASGLVIAGPPYPPERSIRVLTTAALVAATMITAASPAAGQTPERACERVPFTVTDHLPPEYDSLADTISGGVHLGYPVIRGIVVLMFKKDTPLQDRIDAICLIDGEVVGGRALWEGSGIYIIRIPDRRSAEAIATAVGKLKRLPQVNYASAEAVLLGLTGGPTNVEHLLADSLVVIVPCAERVIVRNLGRSARRIELLIGRTSESAGIRGRDENPALQYYALIRPLPTGGAEGFVRHQNKLMRLDSRERPTCFSDIPASAPELPPDDYWFSNTEREQTEVGFFPGLVNVSFRDSVPNAAKGALLRELRGSVVAMAPARFPGQDYIVWFDGDDSTVALARERTDALLRSGLVRTASPMTFGGIWGSPPAVPQRIETPRIDAIEPRFLCRDHLSLRNYGDADRSVRISAGRGSSIRRRARGRIWPGQRPAFTSTIVVIPWAGDSVDVDVRMGGRVRLVRPSTPCVRDLPAAGPDPVSDDYVYAQPDINDPKRITIRGLLIVSFALDAPLDRMNALVREHGLTYAGGRTGVRPSWVFWVEDDKNDRRVDALVAALNGSPIVDVVWRWSVLAYGPGT